MAIDLGLAMLGSAGISAIGGLFGNNTSNWPNFWAQKNYQFQKNQARNQITWRVNDAIQAGIHPLAALGANPGGYSPVSGSMGGGNNYGDVLQGFGQDLGRAFSAMATRREREAGLVAAEEQAKQSKIATELAQMELDSKRRGLQAQSNPPMPDYTNPSDPFRTGKVQVNPLQRTVSPPNQLEQTVGSLPSITFGFTGDGFRPYPAKDLKESMEDMVIPEAMWTAENYIKPYLSEKSKPPLSEVRKHFPKAIDSRWDKFTFQWVPVYKASEKRSPDGYPVDFFDKLRKKIVDKFRKDRAAYKEWMDNGGYN